VHAAVTVHSALGPGLLESVYEAVLARELERRGVSVARQVAVPIEYEGMKFDEGFRADIIVEGTKTRHSPELWSAPDERWDQADDQRTR
jgi:iron complex transport system substrate-binding protein